ncbi:ABC transporter permease subunit [Glycomyces buryatensis]|uniref:ABC transporter permease n=1 Tax=Glycomyces buryatensis TaxID=2570927 RepID=A0A4S8PPD2_9ACTN|nr:ABC transporter permease subunit [Glycomyces buryatensis]THV32860.1 hypothetical protein FAB82_26505 [Glycomyces buryatensis]
MTRSIFTQTLKEQRRGLIGWSIALFAVPMMYVPSYESFAEQGALDMEGGGIYDAMGMGDFNTAAGYLDSTMFSLMGPLLLLIFAITFGARTASQEESGTLDLILAQPVSRTKVLAQRFAALTVQTAIVTGVFGAAILAGASAGNMDLPAGNILAAVVGTGLLALAFGAITQMVGALTGHRASAIGISAIIAVAGYFANNLGGMDPDTEWLRYLSPFYYATGDSPLTNGWNLGLIAVLVILPMATLALSLSTFNRRDLAV